MARAGGAQPPPRPRPALQAPPPRPAGLKLPLRSAPPPPNPHSANQINKMSEFDIFTNSSAVHLNLQKKKPPPRPPPPKFNNNYGNKPELPSRPAHFNRKPTVLNSLMSRRPQPQPVKNEISDFQSYLSPSDSECNVTSLIDLSSPSSSPTLTMRSSSDGVSVDSFGSDITSSTGNGNMHANGENLSQAESGFEDDFDPFSPPKNKKKNLKPVYGSDFLDPLCNGKTIVPKVQTHNIPTIIRSKPARPKAPKNSALLSLNLQPELDLKPNNYESSLKDFTIAKTENQSGGYSPPMPSVPPPPPPLLDADDVDCAAENPELRSECDDLIDEEPFAIALYDYPGLQDDDLPFRANDKIRLLRRMNEEWLYGKTRSGMEGIFPINYVEIKIPLAKNAVESVECFYVTALYDFIPQQTGDLGLTAGRKINVTAKLNEEWLYGEFEGQCGQFPSNYVDHIPIGLPIRPPL